jgi:DNA-binding phage protein
VYGKTVLTRGHSVNTLGTEVTERDDADRLRDLIDQRYPRRLGGIKKLAEDAGVRRQTLYELLRGNETRLGTLGAVAEALGFSRAQLLALIDGEEFLTRDDVALEVVRQTEPLRALMREAGLLPRETTPDEAARAEQPKKPGGNRPQSANGKR